MNLGTEESIEVWFLPANHEAYLPRLLQYFHSVDVARDYINSESARYSGWLEIVRATTTRQRVAQAGRTLATSGVMQRPHGESNGT